MATLSPDHTHCPPPDQLAGLIHNDLSGDKQAALADHVGGCSGCQKKLDALATVGDPALSAVVRGVHQADPPRDSAFWRALSDAEHALTAVYPVDAPAGELKLDFLRPSATPGALGRLGRFDIQRVIGRGGMGVVLRATDPDLSRDVAVKILDPQLASNDLARQRFTREARAAAAVSHANLVAVYQVDTDEGSGLPFLVMQLVDGESLEQRLKRVGRLTPDEAVRLGAQAAAGLAGAHAHGLIHRDIKPGNILIDRATETVRLTDFGLARATEDLKLTRTGFVAGTPLYMAPEQARGDEVDHRADLFSLGSVLYEALAGRPPFDGKTPLAVLRRVADEAHPRLRRLNKDVPEWLEDVIDQLLAKEPGERFQSAAALADRLGQHVPGVGSQSPAAGTACAPWSSLSPRMRRRVCYRTLLSLASTFLVGTLLGGSGVWLFGPGATPAASPQVAQSAESPAPTPAADLGPDPTAVLPGKSGTVWAVAVSPDGNTLAVGTEGGRVGLWDAAAGKLLFDLHPTTGTTTADDTAPAHKGAVWAAAFTPDGQQLVTAGDDGAIRVWAAADGKPVTNIATPSSPRAAAVSPDGNLVAVGDRQGRVWVFDLRTQKPVFSQDQETAVTAVAFDPDGRSLATGGADGRVTLWDLKVKRRRSTLTGGHTGPVYGLAFPHVDGDRLASAGWDGTAVVWDLKTTAPLRTLAADKQGVWAVEFTPCGKLLATAGQGGRVGIWDTDTGKEMAHYARHAGAVHAVRFGPVGTVLAAGGRDGTVRVWAVDCDK